MILAAAVLDLIDGPLARKFGTPNRYGAQLDGLSDFVAFGIAPVALIHATILVVEPTSIWLVLTPYPVAGLFRLARFSAHQDRASGYEGLTISMSGVTIALACLTGITSRPADPFWGVLVVALAAVLSPLMLARFRYPNALSVLRYVRRLVWAVPLLIAPMVLYPLHTLLGLALIYDFVPVVAHVFVLGSTERKRRAARFETSRRRARDHEIESVANSALTKKADPWVAHTRRDARFPGDPELAEPDS